MTGVSEYRLGDGSKRWRVRLYHQGTQYKWSGFTTKSEASAWYQDRKRDIREGYAFPGPDATGILTGEILARYRAQSSNKKNFKNELPYAVFWTDRLGVRPLQSVTSLDIEQARTHLLEIGYGARGPLSHATVNRYVAWLRHVTHNGQCLCVFLSLQRTSRVSMGRWVCPVFVLSVLLQHHLERAILGACGYSFQYCSWPHRPPRKSLAGRRVRSSPVTAQAWSPRRSRLPPATDDRGSSPRRSPMDRTRSIPTR